MSGSARGWLPDARYRQHAFIPSAGGKNVLYECRGTVIGAWASVRCTGVVCQYGNEPVPGMRKTGPSHTMSIIPKGMAEKLSEETVTGKDEGDQAKPHRLSTRKKCRQTVKAQCRTMTVATKGEL